MDCDILVCFHCIEFMADKKCTPWSDIIYICISIQSIIVFFNYAALYTVFLRILVFLTKFDAYNSALTLVLKSTFDVGHNCLLTNAPSQYFFHTHVKCTISLYRYVN